GAPLSGIAALLGGTHFAKSGDTLQCPSDTSTIGHARWRRRPSRPPRSSTTATQWAPPRRVALLHRPVRPTVWWPVSLRLCDAAGGGRLKDKSAMPTSLPGGVAGRAAG